jgi:hypothetical protein
MEPHFRAGIGSVSKVMTALGIFRLQELAQEEGYAFSLDDFLYGDGGLLDELDYEASILAGVYNGIASGNYDEDLASSWFDAYFNIRLRNLLTHTSGFESGTGGAQAVDEAEDMQQRRLAAAGRAHDGDELAFVDIEADGIERRRLDEIGTVELAERLGLDNHLLRTP